jgi:glycosyltransferase involved in cell wall biosynthesis
MTDELQLPKFDLLVATVGRTAELGRLIESLVHQPYRPLRLIVVDQNEDDRIGPVLSRLPEDVPSLRLSSKPGLSRARNVGLEHVEGDVVAFADDDCWYDPTLIVRVAELLEANPQWGGVTGRTVDHAGRPSGARWGTRRGPIDRFNVWFRAMSCTIFLRREVVEAVGGFDEELGPGAGTGFDSGDETDYLLRALEGGTTLWYEPSLSVFHPDNRLERTEETIASASSYGAGMGRVLQKHRYPWWFPSFQAAGAAAQAALGIARGRRLDARFHWAVARGRIRGWRT